MDEGVVDALEGVTMSDLEAFRSEARTWLEAHAPKELRGAPSLMEIDAASGDVLGKARKRWLELMADQCWTAPMWPTEYGGGGLSSQQARVLQQEIARLRLPPPTAGMGLRMIGPTLLLHGNEAQKREHLPRIVRGQARWCQGFSEPNAGSDLAAIQTSARRDGDDYVVNGQKTWTSGGMYANWIFVLVRTDNRSKYDGITFLLVPMRDPGIEVRPIRLISGNSPFCETFFTNVRVPVGNAVGGENHGWPVAKTLLGFERSGDDGGGGTVGQQRDSGGAGGMVATAKKLIGEKDGKVADASIRDRIVGYQLDRAAFKLTRQRAQEMSKQTGGPGSETSLFKLYATELGQRRDELMLAIRGTTALGWEGDGFAPDDLAHTRAWLSAKATTIYAGTSEIQRNIIAKRVLRLPQS
jgi:alkylation response protein AidB-like acyl-CoA dehydrogenase